MPNQETQILPAPTVLQILEHEKLLGTGKSYEIPHLLTCYEIKLWEMEENKEWTNEKFSELTAAKFILLREKVFNQLRTGVRFDIVSPFENTCTKCKGSGEIYKFVRKTQPVTCMKCNKGKLSDGSDCKICGGKGKLKTFAITPQLRGTTTCHYCKGKGFFKKQEVDNPIIDIEAAKELKKKIQANLVEAPNFGDRIQTAETDQVDTTPMIEPGQDEPTVEETSEKQPHPD